jgi:glutamate/tyrosine decarboxylase-like PLP-dependent enzyme
MDRIRDLFPSINGDNNKTEEFLNYLGELLFRVDKRKDGISPTLTGKMDRDYKEIIAEGIIPKKGISMDKVIDNLDQLTEGHPYCSKFYMLNAVPHPSMAGLLGYMLAGFLNANNIWDVFTPAGAEAEVKVTAMMARVLGYNPKEAGGFFSYGGQGGIFNALRIGIEKAAPNSRIKGIPDNIYAICSDRAHFSLKKAVETGMGINRIIKVKTNQDTTINLDDFAIKLDEIISQGGRIALVLATTGTTDTFAIDNIGGMKEIIDQMVSKHKLDYTPHFHADGAMGGLYAFFNLYDFDQNELGFDPQTLAGLKKIHNIFKESYKLDSISIDFHKLGQAPYNNSIFLVKNNTDFTLVNLDEEHCPYIGEQGYGEHFTHYTAESSRMAAGIAAYASLLSFGIEGYQKLLGHYIQLSLKLKEKLEKKADYIKVMNRDNVGPIVLFRVYNNVRDYNKEINGKANLEEIKRVNDLNEDFYRLLRKNKDRMFFGDTKQSLSIRAIDTKEEINLNATKAFMISPYTQLKDLDNIVDYLDEIYCELIANYNEDMIKLIG